MEEALVRLLKVAFNEVLHKELKPEQIVCNILQKAEVALSPSGEQELIKYLNTTLKWTKN